MNGHVVVRHFMSNVEPYYFRESDVGQAFIRTRPRQIRVIRGVDWSFGCLRPTIDSIRESAMILIEYHHDYLKMKKCNIDSFHTLKRIPEDENWDDGNWISVEKCIEIFPTIEFETETVTDPFDSYSDPYNRYDDDCRIS